jgi:hypothetical protein
VIDYSIFLKTRAGSFCGCLTCNLACLASEEVLNGLSFVRRTDSAVYRVLLITRKEQQQQQELQHGDAHSCCLIQLVTVHFV